MQENLYKKIKNGIKKGIYILGGIGLISIALNTGVLAQEGPTIDDKINEEPNPTKIGDEIKEEPEYLKEISDKIEKEQEYFKKTSDEINENFQKTLANYIEIGGKPATKKTINGIECYSVEGLDCILLKIELGDNISPGLMAGINYAIVQGFKGVASILDYTTEEINLLKNAIETEGEKTYAYVKLKDIWDTKSSAQDKVE